MRKSQLLTYYPNLIISPKWGKEEDDICGKTLLKKRML